MAKKKRGERSPSLRPPSMLYWVSDDPMEEEPRR
jgi:hypothetical protein